MNGRRPLACGGFVDEPVQFVPRAARAACPVVELRGAASAVPGRRELVGLVEHSALGEVERLLGVTSAVGATGGEAA